MKKVMVETVVISKNYFLVELNDQDPVEWAGDDVVCNRLTPVKTRELGYEIDSIREISDAELQALLQIK